MTEASLEATGTLTISLREGRLVAERILLLTGVPAGLVPAVRDAVLTSEALGLGGFRLLRDRFEQLKSARPEALSITRQTGRAMLLDAAGEHAWAVAPALFDLAVASYRMTGLGVVIVENVLDIGEMRILPAAAPCHGVEILVAAGPASVLDVASDPRLSTLLPWRELLDQGAVDPDRGAAVIIASEPAERLADAANPVLARIGREGLPVESSFWWELYHLSNRSLTPDSVASRRHAGPLIVEASGRIIGRSDLDDDTDLDMLAREIALESAPPARGLSNRESGAQK